MDKKITKRENINTLLSIEEVKNNPTLVEFLNHEIELLDKRNENRSSKPTKKQKENTDVKAAIVEAMEKGKAYQIKDMLKTFDCLAEMSNQRVSALLRQLIKEGAVIRTEEKRVAYFALAD